MPTITPILDRPLSAANPRPIPGAYPDSSGDTAAAAAPADAAGLARAPAAVRPQPRLIDGLKSAAKTCGQAVAKAACLTIFVAGAAAAVVAALVGVAVGLALVTAAHVVAAVCRAAVAMVPSRQMMADAASCTLGVGAGFALAVMTPALVAVAAIWHVAGLPNA